MQADSRHGYSVIVHIIAALGVPAMLACGGGDDGDPDAVTYHQQVKPIIDARCVSCHQDGGIAPFSLATYEDAATYADLSGAAVELGIMPPWHAKDGCDDYFASRALEDDEKATFLEWVATGARAGDPGDPAPALEVEQTSLSRVDLSLTMPEGYTPAPAAGSSDDYRCFIIPWPETATQHVTGFRVRPGNQAVAHHAIAFLAQPDQAAFYQQLDAAQPGPGWTCFGGTGGPAREWIGAWVPGQPGADLPPGAGIAIQPGSLVILQMHYNTLNLVGSAVTPDQTSIDLRLDEQVAKVARVLPWANPDWVMNSNMPIPANDPDVMHAFSRDPTLFPFTGAERLEIYSVGLHMHLLGTRARLSIERADGSSDCLLDNDPWDFDWQGDYQLRTPAILDRGDELRVECHWDNTAENQPLIDGERLPPGEVNWGEDSTDEMCLGIALIAVP